MKHGYLIQWLFILFMLIPPAADAQSTLVYSEDFESGNGAFTLNTSNEVGTNTGTNQWIVNNQYSGAPVYANTPDQNNTTGGNINFAPFSNYLHIHDSTAAVSPGVSNANFNPQSASDRFASTSSFCTLGLDSVRIAFFFHCIGAPGANASLYYQADGGPWTAVPNAVFSNQNNWSFIQFYNPDFNNRNDLRFGFRWTNSSSAEPQGSSFGVDGIRVVGRFAPEVYNVRLEIDSITPNPVCRGDGLLMFFSNPVPLCGTGFYEVQMSTLFGDFTNYTSLGIFQLNNENTNMAVFTLPTPSNLNPSDCYRIRVMRVDITPVLVSDTSICINVINCPNQIFTLEPAVVSNPLDTVCIGSVIDVPFYSTGVYLNNTYIAQLSDSNGLFPANPNILGTINDNTTYPPGSIPRGNVPGLVQAQQQPIPPGCNYYIRVISNSPFVIGSVYGPFCIRNCDIETNEQTDVSFCIDNENGGDTLLTVDVGIDPPAAEYLPVNQFQIQVLDFMSFNVINTGVVGAVEAYGDTTVQLSIPILPLLGTIGLIPGTYYMRIVASNSSQPWDNLGTVVRLTIGAPNPSPLDIDIVDINTFLSTNFDGDTTICIDDAIFFRLSPWNPNSTYVWGLNNDPDFFTGGPFNGILFNTSGVYEVYVVETNFGCVGPGSAPATVTVRDLPSATVVGPSLVCEGDTVGYTVPLGENTYYEWGINPGAILDSSSNIAQLYFTEPGTTVISMSTVNECGNRNSTRNVSVRPLPDVVASNDTLVCAQETVQLSTPEGTNYLYYWSENGDVFSQQQQVEVTPDSTTTYYIRVTSFGSLECENIDSVTVEVQYPDTGNVFTLEICDGESTVLISDSSAISYLWSTGETSPFITVSDSGWYWVLLSLNDEVCAYTDSFLVNVIPCYLPLILPNVFTPNGDGFNDFFKAIQTFDYDEFNITIWNRWGTKVHESDDPFFEWDGKDKNGDVLPDGTYFFVASLKHLENEDTQKGTVTILDSKK